MHVTYSLCVRALEGDYRKKAFLMTKLYGRTRDAARAQLGQSLERLRTNHIDLVQIHEVIRMSDPERVLAKDGAIHALIYELFKTSHKYDGTEAHKYWLDEARL